MNGAAGFQQRLQRIDGGACADDAVAAHLGVLALLAQHIALPHALGRGVEDVGPGQALVALPVAGMQRLGLGCLRGARARQAELAGQHGIDVLHVLRVVARLLALAEAASLAAELALARLVATRLGARGILRPLAVERGVQEGGQMLVQRDEFGLRRLRLRLPARFPW